MHRSVYRFGGADIQEPYILHLLWKKGVKTGTKKADEGFAFSLPPK